MNMQIAHIVAQRMTCVRLQVGAVIARKGRIISMGYGGAPQGLPHCGPDVCDMTKPCERTIHAEQNAIAFAARFGIETEGATMYCTHSPCLPCAKLIINTGITRLVYAEEYRKTEGIDLLRSVGITVDQWQAPIATEHELRSLSELGISRTRLHVGQGSEVGVGDDCCGGSG